MHPYPAGIQIARVWESALSPAIAVDWESALLPLMDPSDKSDTTAVAPKAWPKVCAINARLKESCLLLLLASSFALLLLGSPLLIPETTQGTRTCFRLLHHQAVHQPTEILLPLLDKFDSSLIANGLEEVLFVGVAYVKRCCLSEERVVVSTLHLLGY